MKINIFPNIAIGKEETKLGKFSLYKSFPSSASHLRASAYNGITKGSGTSEYYQDYLVVSFYLSRHALELGFKILAAHPLISQPQKGHNLERIWQEIQKPLSEKLKENIQFISKKAWDVISKSITEENNNISNYHELLDIHIKDFSKKIQSAFNILRKNRMLNDEQLFRYEIHNNGHKLKTLSVIPQEDCERIDEAVLAIYNMELLLRDVIWEINYAGSIAK